MPEIKTMPAGPAVPVPTLVQCDQVTILGDGSRERPLRAASGGGNSAFTTSFSPAGEARLGLPVRVSGAAGQGGLNAVAATTVAPVSPAVANSTEAASAYGVVTSIRDDGTVQVASAGLVTLSTAQWDALTGGSGGLTLGSQYYAALGAGIPGVPFLSPSAPVSPGTFVTRVGTALNPTTMLLAQTAPARVRGDQILFGTFAGPALVPGSAVSVTASGIVISASDVGVSNAQSIGLVAALAGGQPIVQVAGIVTLTTAQWAAVTDTGGLTAAAYYVWNLANAGKLTGTAPTASPRLQVGKPISSTQLAITPYLQLLP